jgi:hypothetical protein
VSPVRASARAFPVEEFLQALTAQLDRAQDALALKVSGTARPLTWALKDLTLELKVFVEVNETGRVLWRSAGPNEEGASTVHLDLTTITRTMVEENSSTYHEESDPRTLDQIRQVGNLDAEDERKLDWMGVRTVGQLRRLDPMAVQAVMNIPVTRLQAALAAAAHPVVLGQEVVERGGRKLLAIHGVNLSDGRAPEVRLAGTPVEVLEHSPRALLVKPGATHREGQLEITAAGRKATGFFDLGGGAPEGGP